MQLSRHSAIEMQLHSPDERIAKWNAKLEIKQKLLADASSLCLLTLVVMRVR
jgi:hypothetical protein